ncbi:MAG: RNA polymerase sigma factor [Chloroflexota bacterium]
MADLEDQALIRQMAMGDLGALEELYDRYAHLLYSFALRLVGEPAAARTIVEETFSGAWKMAGAIADQQGTVGDWLISHVHTAGIAGVHEYRARRHNVAALPPDAARIDDTSYLQPCTDLPADFIERRALIKELLRGLSHHRRQAVDLAYFQGYSQDEIAPLTGQSLTTVQRNLAGALESLALVLGGADEARAG